ncbi:MAG: translation elongation factor Ts [Alphaproteobacteria bacterium]|nr:translation elongation factor Ts [Alphaproteobacteria bacterium]
MAEITAAAVKALREQSGAGMMDCKSALVETDGDMDAAMDFLRTKGLAAAAKKAGRAASEGLIGLKSEGSAGAMVEVNSETDFVARNEVFQQFVANVASIALEIGGDFEQLKAAPYPDTGRTVEEEVVQLIATIGENISLRRSTGLSVSNGLIANYMHNKVAPDLGTLGKIGVLVALESDAPAEQLTEIGKNLAMHICSADPQSVDIASLDPAVVERERKILADQARESGKPDDIVDKMVEGRIRKYYEESVLLEQVYVLDTDMKVGKAVEAAAKEAGAEITIAGFVRYNLGEGLEGRDDDFADEVARLTS